MKVLQVIGTLDPKYGGPVEVLRQLTVEFYKIGHRSDTVTLDDPNATWLSDFPGEISALGPSQGKYRYNSLIVPWLMNHGAYYDAVIVHGIWQYHSFAVKKAARRIGLPYFIYVHGALDPWFKREYPLKHLKKMLYWAWAEYRVVRNANAILFTCEEERMLAHRTFQLSKVDEELAGIGIVAPTGDADAEREAFFVLNPALRGRRLFLFMSRIHKKKGLDLLIKAFAEVIDRDPLLHLVIAGPDQDGWQSELSELIADLGISEQVTWTGMLSGEARWGAYQAAEVFCLSSHSENFGIVVAEALARRLPVLISDKVNIWREVEADGAGLIAPDTLDGAVSLLSRWIDLSDFDRTEMADRAQECFTSRFDVKQSAGKLIELLERRIRNESKSSVKTILYGDESDS